MLATALDREGRRLAVELKTNRDHKFEEDNLGVGVGVVGALALLLEVGISCLAFPSLLGFVSQGLGMVHGAHE